MTTLVPKTASPSRISEAYSKTNLDSNSALESPKGTESPTTHTVFSWNIDNLEIISNHETIQDVIKSVHYTYTGTYGDYSAQISGVVGLDPPNTENYIPYQNLTQSEVINWIQTKYDIGLFNKNIIEQIQAQMPTPSVTLIYGLPWRTPDVSGNTLDVSGNTL